MGVDKYQDLECWRLANELKIEVYALVNGSSARHDLKFREQIVDSARSGPRNIAEGFGRYEHPEFARSITGLIGYLRRTQAPSPSQSRKRSRKDQGSRNY